MIFCIHSINKYYFICIFLFLFLTDTILYNTNYKSLFISSLGVSYTKVSLTPYPSVLGSNESSNIPSILPNTSK